MQNQSDDLELDLQNLLIDKSDVNESVVLEERPKHCERGGG